MSRNLEFLTRLQLVECHDSTYSPKASPLVFAKALGSLIWDLDGHEYIDLCAGFGALPLGHSSQPLRDVTELFRDPRPPIEHGMGDVYPSEEKVLYLETIKSMLPEVYAKGALALGGGQSIEIALKTAMLATKKSGFIVFDEGYHGLDLGVLPLTAREDFKTPFLGWLTQEKIIRLPFGCSRLVIEQAVMQLKDVGFAGVLTEPIQGRAGVKQPPDGWLSMLADVTHEAGGLVILDEIYTGFGRLGFISTAEHVDADILCFGKAIGGGFPISACFSKQVIMDSWPKSTGEAMHTGTFFGHPFSLAVGRRTLQEIRQLKLCERSHDLGEEARAWLRSNFAGHSKVKDIRGQGLMIGIEFHEPGFAAQLMDRLREKKVIVLPSGGKGQVLSLSPALNISKKLLMDALHRLAECL
jgi:4-aminobutyrate aminotransferase-like enzyme